MDKGLRKFKELEFIEHSRRTHNNKFDYGLVFYVDAFTRVKIICPIHGMFKQLPYNHRTGHSSCVLCSRQKLKEEIRKNKETEFLLWATNNLQYDYSKVRYSSKNNKVKIWCRGCEEFFYQTPGKHKNSKQGCPKCAIEKNSKIVINKTGVDFVQKMTKLKGDRYDYSKVIYKGTHKPVEIVCKIHGSFWQTPSSHKSKQDCGCPLCAESKSERKIVNWLGDNNIKFDREVSIATFNKRKRFDFYVPSMELYIEYDGPLHYRPVNYNERGYKRLREQQERDKLRNQWCTDNGINLIVITYKDDVLFELTKIWGQNSPKS